MNTLTAPFARHVADTAPRNIADLARTFILAERDVSEVLGIPYGAGWSADDPRWTAHYRRTDFAEDAKDDAKASLAAAFDAMGLDAGLRDKLGMSL